MSDPVLDDEVDIIKEDHNQGQSYVPQPSYMSHNTEALEDINEKLKHLDNFQKQEIAQIIGK